jgi:hypothetical protein
MSLNSQSVCVKADKSQKANLRYFPRCAVLAVFLAMPGPLSKLGAEEPNSPLGDGSRRHEQACKMEFSDFHPVRKEALPFRRGKNIIVRVGSKAPPDLSNGVHSKQIHSKKHPFLFYNKDDIKQAQKRGTMANYHQALESLNTEADKAGGIILESIDRSWWDDAKNKSWSDTYPVIYEKTCLVPLRMAQPANGAALRFAVRGDSKDAEAAKKILLHLSDYSFEFEHYDVGMNYSVWGHLILNTYDILFERFTADQRDKLDEFFTRMGRAVLKNDIYWIENDIGGGINNHLAWHKMMLGCLGLFYSQDELVQYALDGQRGMLSLLELGMVDDGLWCESSLNYHFTAIVPMVYLAEAMRKVNYPRDLYTITTANGRNMKQAFDSMFGVLFPDGSIPPIGDCYGFRRRLWDEFGYVYAYKAYADERYAWLLRQAPQKRAEVLFVGLDPVSPLGDALRQKTAFFSNGVDTKNPQPPDIASRLYPEHGYAFLRDRQNKNYWANDGWCAFLTFDKSGVHCHQDKLSLMLFGCGKLLIADVESRTTAAHAFSAQVQKELNRSTLSHNTVMIDNRDQKGTGERLWLEEYRNLPDEKAVTVMDNKSLLYEGVRQSRTICVRPEYVFDVFQIVSASPHDIHWIAHTTGKLQSQNTSVALEPAQIKIGGPGRWLKDFHTGKSDDRIRIEWTEDSVRFRMTMAAEAGTIVSTCGYPQSDEPDSTTIPMVLFERRAANTIYAAIYQASNGVSHPQAENKIPSVDITALGDVDGRLVYEVTGPWGNRRHLMPRLQ